MRPTTTTTYALLGLLATYVPSISALGINCRGSARCTFESCTENCMDRFTRHLTNYAYFETAEWRNGEKFACSGGGGAFCAFLQNYNPNLTMNATTALGLLAGLKSHGCGTCGSIPTEPGNDVSTGQITINWVGDACGDGPCNPSVGGFPSCCE